METLVYFFFLDDPLGRPGFFLAELFLGAAFLTFFAFVDGAFFFEAGFLAALGLALVLGFAFSLALMSAIRCLVSAIVSLIFSRRALVFSLTSAMFCLAFTSLASAANKDLDFVKVVLQGKLRCRDHTLSVREME